MSNDDPFPLVLVALVVGILLALLFVPPDVLDIRPDRDEPVADAGSDLTVAFGESAVLDGTGSSDDKGIASYEWRIENGPEIIIKRGETVSFLFGAPGEYQATLVVTDHADKTDSDEITITVLNGPS